MDTFLYYANLYLIPMIVVAVLIFNVKNQPHNFIGKPYFLALLYSIEFGIISLIVSWVPGSSPLGLLCIWLGSTVCLCFIVLSCYIWLIYVFCLVKQTDDLRPYRFTLIFAASPLLLYMILLLTSMWHNLLFDVNVSGEYIRGSLAWLPYGIAAGYLLASSSIACIAGRREILLDRKKEFYNLMFFLVLPVIGLTVQSCFYEYPATIPATVLALLIIYFDMLKNFSSRDSLTQLNNRGQFSRYLSARFTSPAKDFWSLIMLDLDGFKEINDVLGHTVGDDALIQMARQLKHTFQENRSFIARYGGDEFVAVVSCEDEEAFLHLLNQFSDNIDQFNLRHDKPFRLYYSLGYAVYTKDLSSPEEMLHLADEQMYENKKAHKKLSFSSIKEV